VRDAAGCPQPHILVRLIDLDLFRDVPLGRYLLAVDNLDPNPEMFYATTFYPGRATRESAKVIELTAGGVNLHNLDLTLGPTVPLRTSPRGGAQHGRRAPRFLRASARRAAQRERLAVVHALRQVQRGRLE
jgi:hypothetical protein